jgi:hypothetical protein
MALGMIQSLMDRAAIIGLSEKYHCNYPRILRRIQIMLPAGSPHIDAAGRSIYTECILGCLYSHPVLFVSVQGALTEMQAQNDPEIVLPGAVPKVGVWRLLSCKSSWNATGNRATIC